MYSSKFQQRLGPGQRSLYNVLKAYSVYDRDVGYVQGMGFLAGISLLYMSEEAFWLLVALLKGAVRAPMEGLHLQYLFQFGDLVTEHLPKLGRALCSKNDNPQHACKSVDHNCFPLLFPVPFGSSYLGCLSHEGSHVCFRSRLHLWC